MIFFAILGQTKLIICFTDFFPQNGNPAGGPKKKKIAFKFDF